ncbi:SPOR domain-containing protein [bacterium]|nr:SPOR domain-containing protein [bacterium]MBU1983270.1 SPOR domain-containing protein [bacterium]
MCRTIAIITLLALVSVAVAEKAKNKTPLDLMLEGRYKEARSVLDNSKLSSRYQIIYYALIESDVARACSLYQVIAIRYPQSDCDTVARARLKQAHDIGYVVAPIAEWADAPDAAKPLDLAVPAPPIAAAEMPAPVAVVSPPASAEEELEPESAVASEPVVKEPPVVSDEASAVPSLTPDLPQMPPVAESESVSPEPEEMESEEIPQESAVPTLVPEISEEPEPEITPPVVSEETAVVETTVVASSIEEPIVEETPVSETPHEPVVEQVAETPAAPITESVESPSRPVSNGHWYIQVGAFGNFDNAHRLAKDLQKAGFPVKLVMRENTERKLLQVRVGGYPDRAAAEPAREKLKNDFGLPTVILSE